MKNMFKNFALVAVAAATLAVSSNAVAAPGSSIGVYFDQDATITRHYATPGEVFELYVIMQDVETAVDAAEYKLNLPADVIILSREYTSDNAINVGTPSDGTAVGFGGCQPVFSSSPTTAKYIVEKVTAMTRGDLPFADTPISLTKFTGGSEGSSPAVTGPRYSDCADDQVKHFFTNQGASMSSTVNNEASSWGTVKAGFSE